VRRAALPTILCSAALIGLGVRPVLAAEPKASIEGVQDRALRQEIITAIGEVKTRPAGAIEARRRARDAAVSAVALLRSEGYYEADVTPGVPDGDPPRAVLTITPGPRFRFAAPEVEWVGAAPSPEVAKAAGTALAVAPGKPARAADVLAAEGRIVAALTKRGYADAVADTRRVVVDHADQSLTPTFRIAAGDLVRLDRVKVITKGKTRRWWVLSLSPWKKGEVYDPAKVAKLEQRLLDAQVYESVTVALAPKDQTVDGLRPVLASLSDRKPRTLELGAGYSTTDGSGVDAKWINYNRLGLADTLTLTAIAHDIQQKLDLELDLPDWRRPDQTLKMGIGAQADRTQAFDDAGGGVRAQVERHWTKTTFLSAGVEFDYTTLTEKDPVNAEGTLVGENLKLFISQLPLGFTLDRSNDPLNPTRGWRINIQADPTLVEGDRRLSFLNTQAQASLYVPLQASAGTVLAGRLKFGSIIGGQIPDVPANLRLYAGGGSSVRGFGYQEVGPRLSDNTPEGGLSLVESAFEVRQRVTRQLGVVVFVDAGSVGLSTTPTFRDVSIGAGIGLRYDLGFGPFRIDLATPLNPRQGDGPIQAYVSIGQAF
jgi:translocation and assembly module TamA